VFLLKEFAKLCKLRSLVFGKNKSGKRTCRKQSNVRKQSRGDETNWTKPIIR
jgi:hypothetical protein